MAWLRCRGGAGLRSSALLVLAMYNFADRAVSAADSFDGSSYARNVSIDDNVDMYWTVYRETETIRIAVHAKSESSWVGVGMSEMGGMEGADIWYFESSTGNITDAHSLVAGTPVVDECSQDWTLLSAEVGDGSIVFEAERAFDTGDTQDWVFADDTDEGVPPTQLISAWGDTDTISYHGTNVAKRKAYIFGDADDTDAEQPLADVKAAETTSYFDVTTKNFSIPEIETHYEYSCATAADLPAAEAHAIGFEGVPQADTFQYVHHVVLTGWYGPSDCGQSCLAWVEENLPASDSSNIETASAGGSGGSGASSSGGTSSMSFPSSYSYQSLSAMVAEYNVTLPSFCEDYNFADLFVWTAGGHGLDLPDDVGFLLGNSSSGFSSISMETHYNNPDGVTGLTDSSGVRVYYTEELRPMDMGILKFGDPKLVLDQVPMPDGKSGISFNCPSSCTDEHFEAEEVQIFNHVLHMHETGQAMRTRQYRKDSSGTEVLVHTADVEYYSFEQAGGFRYPVNETVTIQKGDRFETECFYDSALSSGDPTNMTFGFGSEEEMCIDYLYYYPDQQVPNSGACGLLFCEGEMTGITDLSDDSDFNRTFGIVDSCTSSESGEVSIGSSSSPSPASPGLGPWAVFITTMIAFMGVEWRHIIGAPLV
ncbi:unnamed protein product [Scytosiphon promiscuus]